MGQILHGSATTTHAIESFRKAQTMLRNATARMGCLTRLRIECIRKGGAARTLFGDCEQIPLC